ncbi:hypothetical protein KSP39_PZI013949 [Platanthera zijinensis]|uniref:Retrovirus-related Pol polyprotein from transposon TNT 1-94-like beta-barrel domain-containing protein n=1 Tax=Platanthera zijinensis TaxID=2320716 RepID=A0AAP0BFL5_9ASPA
MTGNKDNLINYKSKLGPKVIFGDSNYGQTEGYRKVKIGAVTFREVAYVNGLKHNFISISQLCDERFQKASTSETLQEPNLCEKLDELTLTNEAVTYPSPLLEHGFTLLSAVTISIDAYRFDGRRPNYQLRKDRRQSKATARRQDATAGGIRSTCIKGTIVDDGTYRSGDSLIAGGRIIWRNGAIALTGRAPFPQDLSLQRLLTKCSRNTKFGRLPTSVLLVFVKEKARLLPPVRDRRTPAIKASHRLRLATGCFPSKITSTGRRSIRRTSQEGEPKL